ncbi:hypothetical protein KND94_001954 [Staphylococcus pseudintermedius]|uniref:hypothetical protein n=1 Tax=Staphylococcus pseudintermedius TaxID=283734 RepID=UPI0019E92334|nr:hypothetical protein [Staphylococcus pseudintermedius]EGQ3391997.1 hypothetical protein [Staphylococcus pseudintermedius]EGQ3597246.1 hypothetical protein [Staphylococcus pseudintermedius]EGQ4238829.1 hypothetical protein [Staphylococcus pseudintermedius]EHP0490864.1 hypothetical protein [Staphylococcus pseudintermedius]EIA5751628.1 hypothetical protein [Staphylococcus pseudintermedius]
MKVIVEIEENNYNNLISFSKLVDKNHAFLINKLISDHITKPYELRIHLSQHYSDKDILEFKSMLIEYFKEAIWDIKESAKSNEAYITDEAFEYVFRQLFEDIINSPDTVLKAFHSYTSFLE